MADRKNAKMAPFEKDLDHHWVDYRPVTFSAYARPSVDAILLIKNIARKKARRKGTEKHLEERFIRHKVTVEIWRRAARMVR